VLRPTTSRVTTDNPETMPFNVDKRVYRYLCGETSYKPTSRDLSARCPTGFFRIADNPGMIGKR